MNRFLGISLICIAALASSAGTNHVAPRSQIDEEHTKWIDNALRSMQAVKVGETRFELLKVFTTEGGISTASQRTYVYRHCPRIKVDVRFAASSRDTELPTDKIVEISRPYLDWSIMD
jgi:hypothetical protein